MEQVEVVLEAISVAIDLVGVAILVFAALVFRQPNSDIQSL
jgi:hypothetical protein